MTIRNPRARCWVCAGATLTFSFAGPLLWDGRIASLYEPTHPHATSVIGAERSYARLEVRGLIERLETGEYEVRPRVTVTFREDASENRPETSGAVDLRLPYPVVGFNP